MKRKKIVISRNRISRHVKPKRMEIKRRERQLHFLLGRLSRFLKRKPGILPEKEIKEIKHFLLNVFAVFKGNTLIRTFKHQKTGQWFEVKITPKSFSVRRIFVPEKKKT
jgi:hypothetical protein